MKDTYSAKGRAILRLDREIPVLKVKKALDHEAGVTDYDINYVNNYVRVEFDPRKATVKDIQKLVHK